ncbi:hypothetical protein B0H14DRAFT_3158777 [Mycena olivaceomarginata]|nr:hypothetical protein B0H14DRAFT_3158777 [Mycena olivaceomarginata]
MKRFSILAGRDELLKASCILTLSSHARFPVQAFLSKLMGPPGKVICGQLILQIMTWGFFVAVWKQGPVDIPTMGLPQAALLKAVGFVCTWISTGFAMFSSFLFSWGVRHSITLHLNGEGMTFATFLSSVQIASRSLIRDPKQLRWTILSIGVVALASAQTSGWSTFLKPGVLYYSTKLTGQELDLSSLLLQPMLSSGALNYCTFDSTNLVALTVGQTASGYSALNGILFPTSLTLMDNAFQTSTAGILPLTFGAVNASSWFPNATLPATLSAPSAGFRHNIAVTSSIRQQGELADDYQRRILMREEGFTADVNCEFKDLTQDTTPSLSVETTDSSPSLVKMSSTCAVPDGSDLASRLNYTQAYTVKGDGQGYLLMIACGGSDSYTLIFVGSGLYDFVKTMVCSFTPMITNVDVVYSYDSTNDTLKATTLSGGVSNVGGPAGLSAVTTISNMLSFSQALESNIVGDQLTSVLDDLDGGNGFFNEDILFSMEEYIRGVAEYSGTVFRACLSMQNETVHGVPENMKKPITGTMHTQIFGWEFTFYTPLFLMPGTLIAFATIYVILVAVARHVDDEKGQTFDPGNTLDLVSASAAGGLIDVFSGTPEGYRRAANSVLVLGTLEGQGAVLKRRDEFLAM